MEIGIGAAVSGGWATAGGLGGFAAEAEELGYRSLWTFQRLIVAADQDLGPQYQSVLDPMVALGYVAARTSRIRLGVAVINMPYVSPVYLAKQAATLDVLSGGRLDLGLGVGWSAAEFVATGASMGRRGDRAEEYPLVLRALWADGVSRFDGEFYTVPPSSALPKPVQRPGPPILLGGAVPAAMARAGRIADGWVSRSGTDLSEIAGDIAVVRGAAEEAGRDPASVRVVCRGVVRVGGPEGRRLSGSYDKIREDTAWLAEQGVTDLFYDMNFDPEIGNPDVPPEVGLERAREIMYALRP